MRLNHAARSPGPALHRTRLADHQRLLALRGPGVPALEDALELLPGRAAAGRRPVVAVGADPVDVVVARGAMSALSPWSNAQAFGHQTKTAFDAPRERNVVTIRRHAAMYSAGVRAVERRASRRFPQNQRRKIGEREAPHVVRARPDRRVLGPGVDARDARRRRPTRPSGSGPPARRARARARSGSASRNGSSSGRRRACGRPPTRASAATRGGAAPCRRRAPGSRGGERAEEDAALRGERAGRRRGRERVGGADGG